MTGAPAPGTGPAERRYPGQAEILRGYDPFAHAALAPFGFSPQARVTLLSLSENATYRVDEAAAGRVAVLRVHRTGYHQPGAVQSELAWLQDLADVAKHRGLGRKGVVLRRLEGSCGRHEGIVTDKLGSRSVISELPIAIELADGSSSGCTLAALLSAARAWSRRPIRRRSNPRLR